MEIIILIIIIAVIRNKIQKAKGAKNTTVPNKPRNHNQNYYGNNQRKNTNQQKNTQAKNKSAGASTQPKNAYKQMTMADIKQGKEESTTDYLRKKALQEKLEDKKEKMEQERKNQQVYGRMCYAGRWFEGDPIPDSRKVVKCGYCAAENLVPINDRTKYNCYFCREEL